MAEVVYYVATSIDGFIATSDGGVDWLPGPPPGQDFGYAEFYGTIDGLVMGSGTYALPRSVPDWPYSGKPTRVLSSRGLTAATDDVTVAQESPERSVELLSAAGCRRIWLVGGGQTAAQFRRAGLITEYILTVVPVSLGEGIPLFAGGEGVQTLAFQESRSLGAGVVQLVYRTAAGS